MGEKCGISIGLDGAWEKSDEQRCSLDLLNLAARHSLIRHGRIKSERWGYGTGMVRTEVGLAEMC